MTEPASSSPPPRRPVWPRPWMLAVIGTALAAVLAVVLFVGVGSNPTQASFQTDSVAGVNQATSQMLSLNVVSTNPVNMAPDFTLTDQHGQPVSPAQFRGKVVVVSANDDQCQDLCTFLATDIVAANRDLGPAARHVVWLSINVNPFYPQVSAVKTWTDQHGLGGQRNWYFATGTPAALASVWHKYAVAVLTNPKTRTVTHSTEMFFVDPSGRERAVTQFGTAAANTALFAHGLAQVADDLLPAGERVKVGGPSTAPASSGAATIGASADSFQLPYLGAPGKLSSRSLNGKYTVLNFWSSTCTVCRTELPAVEAAYRATGAHVNYVGVDVTDQPAAARALAASAGLTYPLVSDASGSVAGGDRITGLPYTIIVDPSGHVVIRHPGDITTEQLQFLLENYVPALAGQAGG